MTTFSVSHPKLEIEIKLEEVKKLHIHEQIIPEVVDRLAKAIKKDAHIKHPVIVDKDTLVVLDGMHRVAVFEHLGYNLIPVCLVKYSNPNITIGGWFRIIQNGHRTEKKLIDDLGRLSYKLQKTTLDDVERAIEKNHAIIGILNSHECYGIPGKTRNIKETYDYIKQLEEKLRSLGYEIGYETEKDAVNKASSGEALAAVIAPRITKKDVVNTALRGEVFYLKATRHMIPARPLFVNVPIEWLNMDSEEANKKLFEHLSKKQIKHLPPGQTLDRRYEEELYVFE
jgi:hypothetical protein